MANIITNTRLHVGVKNVIQYVCIASDGTQETDLIIYDSSVVAGLLGITDPLDCKINSVQFISNSKLGVFTLEWDATTDVLAIPLPNENPMEMCFKGVGGLKNTAGAGKTGDISFTSTGLVLGDKVTIILNVGVI